MSDLQCDGCGKVIVLDVEKLNNFERAILNKKHQGEKVYCERCWLGTKVCPFMSPPETQCLKRRCAVWVNDECGLVSNELTRVMPIGESSKALREILRGDQG